MNTRPQPQQPPPLAPAPYPDPAAILVGVPALDEEAHIAACLRSLVNGSPAMRAVRIVVADGGSRDRTRAVVESLQLGLPNLMLIDNPDRLQSAAMNRIVATCAAPAHRVLVRCDAHAIYPRGYVLDAAASLLDRDAAAVASAMDATGSTGFARAAAWIADTPLGSGGARHRGGARSGWVDHGHHAAIRLDWFQRVGGYDPAFSHNEDAELDHRLGRAGGRVWLDAGLRLAYVTRPTLPALAGQYWRYGRGRARTILKHRARPRLRQVLPPAALVGAALGIAGAPLNPWALLLPGLYLATLAGASLAGAVRLRAASGLWAGPAAGTMHLAWAAGFLRECLAWRLAPAPRGLRQPRTSFKSD